MKGKEACCDCLKKTGQVLTNFCENTSIPGLHMVVYEGKHWTEKLLWALIVLGGFTFSVYFCRQLYVKWEDNPTLTTVESNFYLNKDAPFPAVTICNANKVSMSKLTRVMANNNKYAGIPISKMQETLSFLTNLDQTVGSTEKITELDQFYRVRNISSKDLFHLLRDTAPVCRDMILDCVFQGHARKSCIEYFSFLPTDDGFCCVFNSANNFSDPDLNIQSIVPAKKLYLKGTGPHKGGLSVVINANVADYSVPHERFDGFKVLVHSSDEFSDVSNRGFAISPGHEIFVALKGTSTSVTSDVVDEVSPQKRQCEVLEQRTLNYFTNYSRPKCIIDCIIKEMLKKCGCRPYFLKAEIGTPLCDLAKHLCINIVYEDVITNEPCNCLPLCNADYFETEISYATFPGQALFLSNHSTSILKHIQTQLNLNPDVDLKQYLKMNVARLHVFLKDKTSLRYKTDVRYDVEDFVSNIGGLLGLGVGICFISVVEIFYFLCIRGFVKIAVKKYKSRNGHRPIPSD